MSREPSSSGQRKLLKPESTGSAYRKIIVTPCIVNSWLYCSGVSSVWFGLRELRAHHRRLEAADEQEEERRDEVALADRLVIDRGQRAEQAGARSPRSAAGAARCSRRRPAGR